MVSSSQNIFHAEGRNNYYLPFLTTTGVTVINAEPQENLNNFCIHIFTVNISISKKFALVEV